MSLLRNPKFKLKSRQKLHCKWKKGNIKTMERMALATRSTKEKLGRRAVAGIDPDLVHRTPNRSHVPQEEVITMIVKRATRPSTIVEKKTSPTIVRKNTVVSPIVNQETKEAATMIPTADAKGMKEATILKGLKLEMLTRRERIRKKRPKKSVKKESQVKFESEPKMKEN